MTVNIGHLPENSTTTVRVWGIRRVDGSYVEVSGEDEARQLLADDPDLVKAVAWRDVTVGPWLPNWSMGTCLRCSEWYGAPHATSCPHHGKNVGDKVR